MVTRYGSGARAARAAAFVAGGIIGGTACIIVPVLHFITTWALPLLGIVAGIRASKTWAVVREVTGDCPHCGESVEMPGGKATDEPPTGQCPSCKSMLEIIVAEAAADAPPGFSTTVQ